MGPIISENFKIHSESMLRAVIQYHAAIVSYVRMYVTIGNGYKIETLL